MKTIFLYNRQRMQNKYSSQFTEVVSITNALNSGSPLMNASKGIALDLSEFSQMGFGNVNALIMLNPAVRSQA